MDIQWVDGFTVKVSVYDGKNVVISANQEGLLSLAKQLIAMAAEEVGSHIHYDVCNSLEEGSSELVIKKIG